MWYHGWDARGECLTLLLFGARPALVPGLEQKAPLGLQPKEYTALEAKGEKQE